MTTAISARMVVRWECGACKHVNHYDFAMTPKTEAVLKDIIKDMDPADGVVEPGDFALMPEHVFCVKCETQNAMPEDFGG